MKNGKVRAYVRACVRAYIEEDPYVRGADGKGEHRGRRRRKWRGTNGRARDLDRDFAVSVRT